MCLLCTVTGVLIGQTFLLWRITPDAEAVTPVTQPILADHPPTDPRPLPGEDAPMLVPPPEPLRPLSGTADEDAGPLPSPMRPEPLPVPQHALPLPGPSPAVEALRELIARELPGLTAEETEIWAEELEDLPPNVAQQILRFRGTIGREPVAQPTLPSVRPVDPSRLVPSPLELPPSARSGVESHRWQPTLDALRSAIDITLHNLTNAETPGYKRIELVWSDGGYDHQSTGQSSSATVAVGSGVRLATRLDMSAGRLDESARCLDWAINGEGFFRVRDGEAIRYTRSGRFSVHDGRVVLRHGDDVYPLEPPVAWSSESFGLDVLPDGAIVAAKADDGREPLSIGRITLTRFDAPEQLRPVGGLLYEATPAAGEPRTAQRGQSGCGTVVTHRLEGSNVEWDWEQGQLIRLRHRLDALTRLIGTNEHTSSPRPVATIPAIAEPSPVRPVSGLKAPIVR
jgi:flagellar basal body rod protein FlgG